MAITAWGRVCEADRALELLDEMTARGKPPNDYCVNAAISACGKGGQWRRAVSLLDSVRTAGGDIGTGGYQAAITACARAEPPAWRAALSVLRDCRADESAPLNEKVYGAAISACRHEWRSAVALLHAMRRVIEQSYLCGYEPCLTLLEGAVRAVLRQGAPALAVGALVLLLLPTVCFPLWRRQMNVLADRRYHALYHQPYGEQHFRTTDWRRRSGYMLDDAYAM